MSESSWALRVEKKFTPTPYPAFTLTVIIPIFNCSEKLRLTLESIKRQNHPPFEVIIIDAMSTDHSLEIARSYLPFVSRIYSVSTYHLFDMINRGISLSSGAYITVLTPGSLYLSDNAYGFMAEQSRQGPSLIYCGSIVRESGRVPRKLSLPFSRRLLEKGNQVATLSACFFNSELFEKVGKFRTDLAQRGLFDLFLRLRGFSVSSVDWVLVDFDGGRSRFTQFFGYVKETWSILYKHLGFWKASKWFLGISHMRLIRWVIVSLKRRLFKA